MNPKVTLETERLLLRQWNLSDVDRAAFHFLMSDEKVREFYPTRKTREESDTILDNLVAHYAQTDMAWIAACLKDTGEPIGFTGLAHVNFEASFTPNVEIGWLYNSLFWRRGLASEAAHALLQHGFDDLELSEIVAFTAAINKPSAAVMNSLGMVRSEAEDFDHPMVSADAAHLKPHILYRMTRSQWQKQTGQ